MKKKILAIDDEKSIRFIIENTFNKDFEVTTLNNGMDALFFNQVIFRMLLFVMLKCLF